MSRKQHFIERDDMEEYSDISYRAYQFTPKKGFEMGLICGSYKNLQSSSRQQRSNFSRQSHKRRQTIKFKHLMNCSNRRITVLRNKSQCPISGLSIRFNRRRVSARKMRTKKYSTINDSFGLDNREDGTEDARHKDSNNILEVEQEGSDRQQQKCSNNNGSQWKVFSLKKEIQNDQIVELGKADDFEKYQIVYIQQNINGLVGRLSHLLQNQSQKRLSFRNSENDEGGESCFSFNRNSNQFVKIYKCKFCSQKFQKACSLGGHISRSHKEESQQSKKEAQPIKKTSIQKQKKASLQKSIGMQLMRL
ncbi:unnamed protein product (macronuclear) [Paramecium tetraurelia]|uniref:C2H2-type domain-containing protein n=1 Tax=Paramecium tetraurelia TaxID=5888 RepID=A0EAL5_PARTE|nr:uncharacterized protein GSPATT00025066001 [Paramecium tetraurelia]CAK92332.1 unnamed protein product [Paramecium tetraurelia]|eukprot:XP_001459729.1 hypothetical protein (macronuclear) [Paramecium tetraurelia strain d4-2]